MACFQLHIEGWSFEHQCHIFCFIPKKGSKGQSQAWELEVGILTSSIGTWKEHEIILLSLVGGGRYCVFIGGAIYMYVVLERWLLLFSQYMGGGGVSRLETIFVVGEVIVN